MDLESKRKELEKMVNSSIDQLNADHSFASTSLKNNKKKQKSVRPVLKAIWFKALTTLAVAQVVIFYFALPDTEKLSEKEASEQLLEKWASNSGGEKLLPSILNLSSSGQKKAFSLTWNDFKSEFYQTFPAGYNLPEASEFEQKGSGYYYQSRQ